MFLAKHKSRFPKYAIVGLSGVAVNEGLLFLLTEVFGVFYLVSSIIAIETSIITNFLLNNAWTFRDVGRHRRFVGKLGRFNLVSLVGLALNMVVLFLLTSVGVHYLVSNLFGIAAAVAWNYLMNFYWTWGVWKAF